MSNKKLTPDEQHKKNLVLKLKDICKTLDAKPRLQGEPAVQQQMADGIGVPRETLNRWINWRMPPRGLSIPAIERYIGRVEAE